MLHYLGPVVHTTTTTSLVVPRDDERLTAAQRVRVAVEIVATYAQVRWWLLRLDFPASVAAARGAASFGGCIDGETATLAALRLGAIVQRLLGALPFDSRCLIRSLVLTRMLTRRGVGSIFVVGVRAKPHFLAHAWLERDGVPLLPTRPEFHRLTEL